MRHSRIYCASILGSLTLASVAHSSTLYVSPTGTESAACTKDAPCALTTGASTAKAGDTVILLDGVYTSRLDVKNSGTSSAWITFQADECATPIIEGKGVETNTGDKAVDQPVGVGSTTANYVRFVGLVSRGWNIGFGNGWIKETQATISNGHIEYKHCIADRNGRTGFTFFSAEGIHIQSCIAAHNGNSAAHSWSSGIALFEAQGTGNLVESSVSFENTDAQQHTDGSGFIADENSNGATFINNIAFRNGGSCLRLTVSSNVKFINNTCYHNAQDMLATGPDNPSEIYVTDAGSRNGSSIMNNTFYSTGVGPGAKAVFGQPATGWSNNVVQDGGAVSVFASPEGTNPDFTLTTSASALTGKGATGNAVPTTDIGFDPKCITKKDPAPIGDYTRASWWNYSVDIEYIKSIGGVARCFRPKPRSGAPDIGAYANGAVTALPGECVRTSTGGAPSGGGGTTGNGGSSVKSGGASNGTIGGSSGAARGGTSSAGGSGNASGGASVTSATSANSGGANASSSAAAGGSAATTSSGGSSSINGGNTSLSTATQTSSTAAATVGGSAAQGTSTTSSGSDPGSGCGCRIAGQGSRSAAFASLGCLALAMLRLKRRRLE